MPNRDGETNYPGVGLTAEVQAFNSYKLWHERQRALTPEQYVGYDKLVRDFGTEQHRARYHPDQPELDRVSKAIRPNHSRSPREGYR